MTVNVEMGQLCAYQFVFPLPNLSNNVNRPLFDPIPKHIASSIWDSHSVVSVKSLKL